MSKNDNVKVGLALSGGGFRASAFHLGVLKRLEELEILPQVETMSTVSGGAITGGLYALQCVVYGNGNPGSYSIDKLIDDIYPLFGMNLRRSFLWGTPKRMIRTLGSFVFKRVSRFPNLVEELDKQLFDNKTLNELPPWILINATNLATGKNWKFFSDRVGDYFIGATDKTQNIPIAEAVGASAAYPMMVDPYLFKSKWEDLRVDLLDKRWSRPSIDIETNTTQWRKRFGKCKGELVLPIADGGLYDNLGLNSLKSSKVTHAIYSSSSILTDDYKPSNLISELLRVVGVIHERLGNVSKQHTHEMTHAFDPSEVGKELELISKQLMSKSGEFDDKVLLEIARKLKPLSKVSFPPRGHQYNKAAPILLNKNDLAKNVFVNYVPSYDVPEEYRGLCLQLVPELARVRTDLDAHRKEVINLLIAQGYFLTDAQIKVSMPELIDISLEPTWSFAQKAIEKFNGDVSFGSSILIPASKTKYFLGRSKHVY